MIQETVETTSQFYQQIQRLLSTAQQRKLARMLAYDHPDAARAGIRDSYAGEEFMFTPQDVAIAVAAEFQMSYQEVAGPNRSNRYARPRQIITDILRSPWFNLSLLEVARILGRSDHTSIIYYAENNTRDERYWDVVYHIAEKAGISHDRARKRIAPTDD